jgi:hypothetical protein
VTARSRVPSSGAGVITDGWGRPKYIRVSALIPASQHEWMSELVAQAQNVGGVRASDVLVWALARVEREANTDVDLAEELVEWFETSRRNV